MKFKTYEDLTTCIVKNLHKIPRSVDLIVGIPRSGTMVGNILALYLNLPFMDIGSFVNGQNFATGSTRKCKSWIKNSSEARHILVVDDSVSSGKAMNEARELLKNCNVQKTFFAVYVLAVTCKKVDIYLEICEQPRMFEWNFMHHWALEYCCMDIDGVLCQDPTRIENDDGKKYLQFIENATPKFIPTFKIGQLVSCRLEKYRAPTEKWLKKNGIEYGSLVMLNGISAKERAIIGSHAEYKAKIYAASDYILFIESDYQQALDICKLSGKPVFCIENRTLISGKNVMKRISIRNKECLITLKRIIRKMLKKINYNG